MPGKSRADMAVIHCHVPQRGNHRDACLYAEQDHHDVHAIHDAMQFAALLEHYCISCVKDELELTNGVN